MELLCPNCQQKLNIPEQYAGQLMRCPLCNGMFQAPSPGGAPPPPPPQFPPLTNEPFYSGAAAPPAPAPEAPPLPPGELTKCCTLTLSPRVVPWLTLASLLLVLLMTFLPWFWFATANVRLNGWNVAFGQASNFAFTVFIILLLLALVLQIPSFMWGAELVPMPGGIKSLGPWRPFTIGMLALISFLFLMLRYQELIFREIPVFATLWLKLAVRFQFVALICLGLEFWLERRRLKNLPPPQIQFHR
jgi:hypothetical protein